MKRVARTVALSLSEAKRLSVVNQDVFNNTSAVAFRWSYTNIFSAIPVASGTGAGSSFASIGNEIVDPLLKFKAVCRIPYGLTLLDNSNNYGTIQFTVLLVAANDFASTTASGGPTPGNINFTTYPALFDTADPGWFLSADPFKPTLNGNNVKVLRRWTKKYHPEIQFEAFATGDSLRYTNGTIQFSIEGKYRWKRKLTYEDNVALQAGANFPRAGYLRGWNYYLLCGWGAPGNIVTSNGQPQMNLDRFLYYKDP